MESIAEFKRLAKVGATLSVVNHVYPSLSGERVVLRAQTARVELSFPAGHPKEGGTTGSWLDFPKAKDCTFDAMGAIVISSPAEWGDNGPFCTIRVLEEGEK